MIVHLKMWKSSIQIYSKNMSIIHNFTILREIQIILPTKTNQKVWKDKEFLKLELAQNVNQKGRFI